jgi:hypothetical protein
MEQTHVRVLKQDLQVLKTIQSNSCLDSLTETLHEIINVQSQEPRLTIVKLLPQDYLQLQKLKEESGYREVGYVIHQILQSQKTTEMVTVAKIMKNCCPCVLTGQPLSGKSYWIKNTLIPSLKDNHVLVIDTNSEYDNLREIKSLRELNLQSNDKVRFCPQQHSIMCLLQVRGLVTELNAMVDADKKALSRLILVVEEANQYKSSVFNGLLYKSRHFFSKGKMIVVTPQTDCFQGLETFTVFR